MSKTGDLKDITIIGAVGIGAYFLYQTFKTNGLFSGAAADLGLGSNASSIERRLKTDSNSRSFDTTGTYARPEKGFYDSERAADGSTVTYAVSESDVANLSPYERGLLARGTDISTIKKIADTRSNIATAFYKYTPIGALANKIFGVLK